MTTTELPPGIYHIVVAGGSHVDSYRLTDGVHVTISPPSAVPDPKQEWQISKGDDRNIIIRRPSKHFPSTYLIYAGAPEKPEKGNRIVLEGPSDLPLNEWRLDIAPGFKSYIRVAGSDLGVALGPEFIQPPFLQLGDKEELEWVFIPVPLIEE